MKRRKRVVADRQLLGVKVDRLLRDAVQLFAERHEMSVSDVVRNAVTVFLTSQGAFPVGGKSSVN